MFRIVSDFVPSPSFLLLCDDRRCAQCVTSVLIPETPEAEWAAAVKPFIETAIQSGWVIGIDRHLCPQHAGRIAQGRRLVEVVPQFAFKN